MRKNKPSILFFVVVLFLSIVAFFYGNIFHQRSNVRLPRKQKKDSNNDLIAFKNITITTYMKMLADPRLRPSNKYPPIARYIGNSKIRDLSNLDNDHRLDTMRAELLNQVNCASEKLLKRLFNKILIGNNHDVKTSLSKLDDLLIDPFVKEILLNLRIYINMLHAAHQARVNQGGRCEELAKIFSLEMSKFSLQTGICFYMQLRMSAIPIMGKHKENYNHGYLLMSLSPIPTKELITFKANESKSIYVIDPYRGIIKPLPEVILNKEKYPYFSTTDCGIEINLECVSEKKPKNLTKKYTLLLKNFYNEELNKLHTANDNDAKKVSSENLEDYSCDNEAVYSILITEIFPVNLRK